MTSVRFHIARALELVVGRRNLVRTGRFLLDYGRRDLPNDLGSNGEWMVQAVVLRAMDAPLVVDVGANVGDWSAHLLNAADQRRSSEPRVYAFEPSAATFEALAQRLGHRKGVVLVNAAASDHDGEGVLWQVHDLAGANSLHGKTGSHVGLMPEPVQLVTLDEYFSDLAVSRLGLLKIDAEGHDLRVLEGAAGLLERGAVEVVQFEYNHLWIGAGDVLKGAFDLLGPFGYRLGKITPAGIEWYDSWDPELETYREANFLAVRTGWIDRFPSVLWWKST